MDEKRASVRSGGVRRRERTSINVNCKTPLGVQMKECRRLMMERPHGGLTLHAVGKAVPWACLIALELAKRHATQPRVNTATERFVDDRQPVDDDDDFQGRARSVSKVHIHVDAAPF